MAMSEYQDWLNSADIKEYYSVKTRSMGMIEDEDWLNIHDIKEYYTVKARSMFMVEYENWLKLTVKEHHSVKDEKEVQ